MGSTIVDQLEVEFALSRINDHKPRLRLARYPRDTLRQVFRQHAENQVMLRRQLRRHRPDMPNIAPQALQFPQQALAIICSIGNDRDIEVGVPSSVVGGFARAGASCGRPGTVEFIGHCTAPCRYILICRFPPDTGDAGAGFQLYSRHRPYPSKYGSAFTLVGDS